MDNVCNRCLFSIPSKVEMAEEQEYLRFYWLDPQYGVNNYCVLCMVKAKKANKNLQHRTLLGFITIPLY